MSKLINEYKLTQRFYRPYFAKYKVLIATIIICFNIKGTEQQSRRRLGGRTPANAHLQAVMEILTVCKAYKVEDAKRRSKDKLNLPKRCDLVDK